MIRVGACQLFRFEARAWMLLYQLHPKQCFLKKVDWGHKYFPFTTNRLHILLHATIVSTKNKNIYNYFILQNCEMAETGFF